MYRLKEIQRKLFNVVGWNQSYNLDKQISNHLTLSESGLYFQDAHPLCTLNNIESIMPDDYMLKYAVWNVERLYNVGDKVRYNNKIWIAKTDNDGVEPNTTNPDDWQIFNMLSDFLEDITNQGIAKVIQSFIIEKGLNKETHDLLERRTFFDGAGRLKATIQPMHKICGFEITPVRSMGVTAKIEKIGLQMTGGTGLVRLYLFHSGTVAPIKTIDVNYTLENGGFQWFPMNDLYLPNMGETSPGGSWYLCYNQNELPAGMTAINVSKDWSREPCGTCNIGNIEAWKELTKYLQISPFSHKAPEDFQQYPEMWDIDQNLFTNTINYGLNVEITVGCDLTDFIISQRALFQSVIQMQVACIALRSMAMNPDVRVNRNQSNVSRLEILYELDGNTESNRPGGLGNDLKKAIKSLNINTQGIDRICLSCNNGGVKYRSV